jgi:hypothetical protein
VTAESDKLTSSVVGWIKDGIFIAGVIVSVVFAWSRLATNEGVRVAIEQVKQEHKSQMADVRSWMVTIDQRLYDLKTESKRGKR